jgi:hypothetical protein
VGSSSSRGHDPRCAILAQGLDAEGIEHIIRTRYAGRICCGMKNGRDGLVQQIKKDLKDKRVYTIIGAAY